MEFVIGYIVGLVLTGILIIVVAGRGFYSVNRVNGGREETLNESSKRSHYKRTRRTSISS